MNFRLGLLVIFAIALRAADPAGTVTGTILDPSGGVMSGARITITAPATSFTRQTTSAKDGAYVFPLLPVGLYNIVAESDGFSRAERTGILVVADQSVAVSVTLQIGAATEIISVAADAGMVETRSGALGLAVTERKIVDLPLNGRNAASLIFLAPGTADLTAANARGIGDTQATGVYPGAQSITSNGARAGGVNYNLDGGSNQDFYANVNNPFPNPDALEEFSVQTNSYSAEYGRSAGGIVNIVTKSGTNKFHGSAFEFLRNGDLNARNFFAADHDLLKRNQFGGSTGGPVLKDRLFFFGTYQGTIMRNVTLGNTATVLTNAQRTGDFSSLARQLIDPVTQAPFAGNKIPASRFDPAAAKLLSGIPTAAAADGLITFNRPISDEENQAMGRVDLNLDKHRLYARYFLANYGRDAVISKTNLIEAARGFSDLNQSASFSDTYTLRPNLLNSFIFSYNRINSYVVSGAPFSFGDLGIPIASSNPPEISLQIAGYFTINTGHPGQFDRQGFNLADSVHLARGRHEIAMGGDIVRLKVDLLNAFRESGQFVFRGTGYSGDPRADFLLGTADRFTQGGGEYAERRGLLGSLFVQDNWRINSNLVLNLGLRWDPFHPYSDTKGRTECYRPGLTSKRFPNAPAGYLFEGDPGCPSGGSNPAYWQFGPRLGFAYNFGTQRKTTIRGGWGIFYQTPFVEAYDAMVDSAPWSPQVVRRNVTLSNPYAGYPLNPFPAQFGPAVPLSDVQFIIPPSATVSYTPDWKPGSTMSWNLTVERELAGGLLVRAAYVGSKGTHLGYNTDANAPLQGPNATLGNEDARRPNQNFIQVIQDVSGANSIYNSLQLSLDRRFSKGFTIGANYTHSKSIDEVSNLSDLSASNIVNPFNARAYRAVSDFNVPDRFILNYLWQLPSPRMGVARALLGGWQTSAIWTWQSGFPLNIISNDDRSLTGIGNDLADLVAQPAYTSGSFGAKIAMWFNTAAFRSAALGTFGTAGRNILTGPGTFNVDFSAQKIFAIGERSRLQYRVEFFNLFNHTQLNNPDSAVTDSTFGRITTARDPRIVQMALKLVF